MMEITIWVEDEYTGSKVNAEKKEITTRDEALHLMGVAWDMMQAVGQDVVSASRLPGKPNPRDVRTEKEY